MVRFALACGLVAGVLATAQSPALAQGKGTVDERFQKLPKDAIEVGQHTRDACDRGCNITVTSTTDGDVVIKPGETKFFEIDKDKDDYTRSGGWYWKCCGTGEKARLKGARYIKAVRTDGGPIDWYEVKVKLP